MNSVILKWNFVSIVTFVTGHWFKSANLLYNKYTTFFTILDEVLVRARVQ